MFGDNEKRKKSVQAKVQRVHIPKWKLNKICTFLITQMVRMVLLINSDGILTKIMLKTLIKIVLRYRYRLKMRCVKS